MPPMALTLADGRQLAWCVVARTGKPENTVYVAFSAHCKKISLCDSADSQQVRPPVLRSLTSCFSTANTTCCMIPAFKMSESEFTL